MWGHVEVHLTEGSMVHTVVTGRDLCTNYIKVITTAALKLVLW